MTSNIMNTEQQIKNILCFLSIVFGENESNEVNVWHEVIMKFTPDYIIEKYTRYIKSEKYQADWGLHPSLRRTTFDRYCDKWKIDRTLE